MGIIRIIIVLLIGLIGNLTMSGKLIDDDFDMSGVKRIRLMGDINLICNVDTLRTKAIEYPDTVTDWNEVLFITTDQGTVTIQTRENPEKKLGCGKNDIKPLVLNVPTDLHEIENGYSSTLEVKGAISTSALKVKLSGNGAILIDSINASKIYLHIVTGNGRIDIGNIQSEKLFCNILGTGSINVAHGVCAELRCKTMGTGKMNLTGLLSENVKVRYSGGGSVECRATDTLTISGMGTTRIGYMGNPRIKRKGNVRPIRIKDDMPSIE